MIFTFTFLYWFCFSICYYNNRYIWWWNLARKIFSSPKGLSATQSKALVIRNKKRNNFGNKMQFSSICATQNNQLMNVIFSLHVPSYNVVFLRFLVIIYLVLMLHRDCMIKRLCFCKLGMSFSLFENQNIAISYWTLFCFELF